MEIDDDDNNNDKDSENDEDNEPSLLLQQLLNRDDEEPLNNEREQQLQRKETLARQLTQSIQRENLLKQKSQQRNVPYLWGISFQLLKQYLYGFNDKVIRRILKALDRDDQGFATLADACYTQICLETCSLIPSLWKKRTIHDYLFAVLCHPTELNLEEANRLFDVTVYTEKVKKDLDLKAKFTPENFLVQWGSSHQSWPVQKKYLHGKNRLGFPLPGSLMAVHREYYILPGKLRWRPRRSGAGFVCWSRA